MFKIDGKYGNIHINGTSIDIEKSKISDLSAEQSDKEK